MTKADVYEEATLKVIGKLLGVHYRRSKNFTLVGSNGKSNRG